MDAFARWLVRRSGWVLLAHAALFAVLGFYASQIRVESAIESVVARDSPEMRFYDDVRATFGGDEIAVIGVRADDIFAAATLEKITRLTTALEKIDGIERALSITNSPDPAADVLFPPRLLPKIPPSPEEVRALKEKLTAYPLYGRNLVAEDFRGAAINVFFEDMTDARYRDLGIDDRVAELLRVETGPEELYYTGEAHVKQVSVNIIQRDLARLTPAALALVLVVFWLSFRTVAGVLLPMLTVVLPLVATLGVIVLAGGTLSLGTFVLPPLLLVIGSSYALHVMARYYELAQRGLPHDECVKETLVQVRTPALISAFTTAVGFGALMVNRIPAIWDLGRFAVVGIATVALTSLTFLPAALARLGPRALASAKRRDQSGRLARLLRLLGERAYERTSVLAVAALIALVALIGARSIRVDSDFLGNFEADSEVRIANEIINRDIVGSNPFYLVIDGSEPDTFKRWEVLRMVKDLQVFLQALPGISASISLVDWLEVLEAGLAHGGEEDLVLDDEGNLVPVEPQPPFWEDPRSLASVLDLVTARVESFHTLVTPDFSRLSILVRTRLSGSRDVEETLRAIRQYTSLTFPAELAVRPTGTLVLMAGTTSEIVSGQVRSLGLALSVIYVAFAAMFLSLRIGALAILPNVLPIIVFFGVLGWLGVLLGLGTSLIATIALGLVVDSTVHYMARLNRELGGETDQRAAVVRTLGTVGVPITYTTVALCLGFLMFAASDFVPIQNFGILCSITIGAALITNITVLPALLSRSKIITLWDMLSVKLGVDPARTIPMFAGLRPEQTRIVVLMGNLRVFAPDETIVHEGAGGEEMFVVIQGRARVWSGQGAERKCLMELGRGDVFGEMALVRHEERSADVIAVDRVEALAVDQTFLRRIQMRYPRIASKVFLNLTRILSDRLDRLTQRYVSERRPAGS